MGKKFKPSSYVAYGTGILTFLRSFLYLTYLITLLVVVFGFAVYSRVHVFSTCLMVLVLDCIVWFVYNKVFNSRATDKLSFKNILESIRMEDGKSRRMEDGGRMTGAYAGKHDGSYFWIAAFLFFTISGSGFHCDIDGSGIYHDQFLL